MKVESRRLQRLGTSSLVVTLPKDWVRRFNLKPGDSVLVYDEGDSIRVVPEKPADASVEISPSTRDVDEVSRGLVCLYIMGYSDVKVRADGMGVVELSRVKRTAMRLQGVEVVEDEDGSLRVRYVADPSKVELINAGISGYTSLQALRLIQKKLLAWDPDVIVIDCRTYDSLREGPLEAPSEEVATLQRLLFHSRLYYVLRFGIDRLRPVQPRRMHEHSEIKGAERSRFGNHDLIVALGKQRGFGVVFLDYPFWNSANNHIVCLAPPEELPPGQVVARGCLALQQSGYPPEALFLDNNHLKPLGNRIVGQALAKAILESNLAPR